MLIGAIGLAAIAGRTSSVASAEEGRTHGAETMRQLRAGAHAIDITPKVLPVVVNGMFLERTADKIVDPLHARCLALDDGHTRIAIVVVDTIGMSREMTDAVKDQAAKSTGIPTSRILISATHTHSAPAVIPCLGSGIDEAYTQYLPPLLVQGIEKAVANLEPARVGSAVVHAPEYTNCRRWVLRPDRMGKDPFGDRTVRANMHPGHQSANAIGPSGPIDPDITLLSVQALDGRPIALLANYSMHYYSSDMVSSDYYGPFCDAVTRRLGAEDRKPPFVAMMSHGTSGDQWWGDYGKPRTDWGGYKKYADLLAERAVAACRTIQHRDDATLQMAETKLTLPRRVPDAKRLAWARGMLEKVGDHTPRNRPEVYAREAVCLHEERERELKLQAVRIGDFGITAIPNEVYALTGLKLKAQSPLRPTMNIELANGCDGYIPPPEQHVLGGYNTWPARTAGLEVQAEPKIVEALLSLLEAVSGKPRRKVAAPQGAYAKAVVTAKPLAWWRLAEMGGAKAHDGAAAHHGAYEDGVVFTLPGPAGAGFCGEGHAPRAAHFAGGRMHATLPALGDTYSVEFWFWNGLPVDARPVTGYLISRGPAGERGAPGDSLGIGGTFGQQGKLVFYNGDTLKQAVFGKTPIGLRTWNHVVLVRAGSKFTIALNGAVEVEGDIAAGCPPDCRDLFVGGRNDGFAPLEGKMCEVAVYARALSPAEAAEHYRLAGITT